MCLNPITIRTKSRVIGRDSLQSFVQQVPCGQCAECKALARSQWYLRNYWQCRDAMEHKGYIFFDTLTYDDAHLPHVSDFFPELRGYDCESIIEGEYKQIDFSCFSHEDTCNFFKRLRKRLSDDGYDVSDGLKYFLTSEYGHEDEYRSRTGAIRVGTMRPHYHVLFYVTVPNLHPLELARYVYESWQNGKTDSYTVNGVRLDSYIKEHNVFGQGYGRTDDVSLRRVASYVAKYVTKDADYEKVVESRLCRLMTSMVGSGRWQQWHKAKDTGHVYWTVADDCKALYKRLKRQVGTFHRQSQGFGMYALDARNFGSEQETMLMEQGCMKMNDEEQVVRFVPVPLYYVRKLYFNLLKDDEGHFAWVPTERGKEFIGNRSVLSHCNTVRRFEDWYANLTERSYVDSLMDGRTFSDLSDYLLFYRGRVTPYDCVVTPDVTISARMEWNPFDEHEFCNVHDGVHYLTRLDSPKTVQERVIDGLNKLYNEDFVYHPYYDETVVSHDDFAELNVINDSFSDDFYRFDELLNYYERSISEKRDEKQATFDKIESLRKKYRK